MAHKMKTITVLGSTGSVGRTTIKLLLENQDNLIHKYYQMGLDGKI